MKPYHKKVKLLEEFKEKAFINAVQLFQDATLLYTHSSYSSSYALAAAAYEEIGKVNIIDHACDDMCLNPESIDEIYNRFFKTPLIKDHKHKQRQAAFDVIPLSKTALQEFIYSGGLEQWRQQALYVDMVDNSIQTPSRITYQKTFSLIELCHTSFHEIEDLGFSGFTATTTAKSEWLASREFSKVDEAMKNCVVHNKTLGLRDTK